MSRSRRCITLPYWFCIDIDADKRPHIHGAFAANLEQHPVIRNAMKTGWGEWEGPGSHKQLWIDTKPSDDG
jgi:hypothetical protein